MKNLCYIFPKGRKKRWSSALIGNEPRDFFYGAVALAQESHLVKILENDDVLVKPRWQDWVESNLTSRICAGVRMPMVYGLLQKLNDADWVIGVPDSIALALGRLSSSGILHSRSIGFFMGLGDKIQRWEKRRMRSFVINYYKNCLDGLDLIMCLGKPEADYLKYIYPYLTHKIHYIPFGIDTEFWSGLRHVDGVSYVLFVGNDPNRDFEMVWSLAESMPEVNFVWVSRHLSRSCFRNVRQIFGDWSGGLDDEEMRDIYLNAKLVILPLKNTLQPTGQSVCLQAMSCGVPVMISAIDGLWDRDSMKDGENCFLMESGSSVNAWSDRIRGSLRDDARLAMISKSGRDLVRRLWSCEKFSLSMEFLLKSS